MVAPNRIISGEKHGKNGDGGRSDEVKIAIDGLAIVDEISTNQDKEPTESTNQDKEHSDKTVIDMVDKEKYKLKKINEVGAEHFFQNISVICFCYTCTYSTYVE